MPVHNADIAAVFDEIADLLEIQGANPFRVRAYRNASRTVGDFGTSIPALVQSGAELDHIRGPFVSHHGIQHTLNHLK